FLILGGALLPRGEDRKRDQLRTDRKPGSLQSGLRDREAVAHPRRWEPAPRGIERRAQEAVSRALIGYRRPRVHRLQRIAGREARKQLGKHLGPTGEIEGNGSP